MEGVGHVGTSMSTLPVNQILHAPQGLHVEALGNDAACSRWGLKLLATMQRDSDLAGTNLISRQALVVFERGTRCERPRQASHIDLAGFDAVAAIRVP